MIKPRWRKVIRDLWGNKTRTVLVVLSIAVGVFAVGTIDSSREIMIRDLSETYTATNPASATFYTDQCDNNMVQALLRSADVREAEGRRSLNLRFKTGGSDWQNLSVVAIQDFNDIRINKIRSVSGAWPPKKNEILLERSTLGLIQVEEGDKVLVEAPNGEQYELRLAGIVHDLQRIPSKFTGQAYGYINFDTLEKLGEPRKFNQLNIVVAEHPLDKEHITRVAAKVRDDKIEASGVRVYTTSIPDPGKHQMDSALKAMTVILEVLGLLSLLLSGFLVVNTISAILAQQTRQIGIMKAVGAVSGQVIGIYISIVVVFGLLALLVAVPLGALGARAFTNFTASLLNFDIVDFSIPPRILLLEIAVGLLVPLIASLYPIISGTRTTVREAISSHGIGSKALGKGRIDRVIMRMNRLPRPILLSLRNTFRRKGRLALTLMTMTLAAAIFISVFSVRASLLETLDSLMNYWKYDIQVSFSQPYRIKQIERNAMRVPGVTGVECWSFKNVRLMHADGTENEKPYILAPPATTKLIEPQMQSGRWLYPGDKNALVVNTDLLKDEENIKLGDKVTLKIDGRKTKWLVVGVVKGQFAGPMAYANYSYFSNISRNAGRTDFVVVTTSRHDPAFQSEVAKTMEERFKSVGLRIKSTETNGSIRSRIKFQFDTIVVFLFIMVVLLAIVGGLGLMGTMSINVLERTREIGVMRATGASDGSVLKIFIMEGIIIGIISWFLGALLSIPLSKFLSDTVGIAFMQVPLSYNYSVSGVLIWLAMVIAIAALASFMPAWKASRLSVREILSYE